MRILHVVPTYLPATRYGGPIFATHGLCKSLAKAGFNVSVFSTNIDGAGVTNVKTNSCVDMDGVEVNYFTSPYLRRLYYSPDMRSALERNIGTYDLVHGHSIYLWPTMLAARTCFKAKIPYVLSPRGMLVEDLIARKNRVIKSTWIRFIERKNISIADAIHFTSRTEYEAARPFIRDTKKSFIVPNGIDMFDVDNFLTKRQSKKEKRNNIPIILYFGRINWKKGLDRLIKSMNKVKRGKLVIAGNDDEGYKQKLEGLTNKYKLNQRVEFRGPLYGKEKYSLLYDADIFVLPSYSENFGNTVLESMALGCPVIVSSVVGLAAKVKQIQAGVVVSGGADSIADGINRLLDDQSMAIRMGRNGREAARKEFSWELVAGQMIAQYQQVIACSENNDRYE